MRLDKCIFKAFSKKAGHTIAHSDPAVCGQIGGVGQTNVILREFCFFFFFLSSFLFSVSRISGVGQSVSSVQSLKKTLRCISVSQPPSRCTLFSLNNMLVKCISTPQPLFFPPSLPPHMAVCKQTTQCCECRHSAPG